MRRLAMVLAWTAALGPGVQAARGMGGDHPKGRPVGGSDEWPAGLKDLVNGTEWFRGCWVNANDWFAYAGDTAALNEFLQKYSGLEGTPLTVVLNPGRGFCRYLGDGNQPKDWELQVLRRGWGAEGPDKPEPGQSWYVVSAHVWLAGDIDLAKLQVPAYVELRSAVEDARIEAFIARHRKPQTQPAVTPAALEGLWEDLAAVEYSRRTRASMALVWAGEGAAKFLSRRLEPPALEPDKLRQWIAQLDSNHFAARQAAQAELAALDLAGLPALEAAQKGSLSPEAARRVADLLARRPLLALRRERAVAVLEQIGTPQCLETLRRLAQRGPEAPEAGPAKAALERLAKARDNPARQPATRPAG